MAHLYCWAAITANQQQLQSLLSTGCCKLCLGTKQTTRTRCQLYNQATTVAANNRFVKWCHQSPRVDKKMLTQAVDNRTVRWYNRVFWCANWRNHLDYAHPSEVLSCQHWTSVDIALVPSHHQAEQSDLKKKNSQQQSHLCTGNSQFRTIFNTRSEQTRL